MDLTSGEAGPTPGHGAKVAAQTAPHRPETGPTRDVIRLLILVVQQLSLARDLSTIMEIVRHAARDLTGADGATFVLREGDQCHYADEDAIAPLWKGKRFPMSACISGWAMLHKKPAVIPDIYADARIPADAYRPTFVHSLAMVPIRAQDPVGAIGIYWATRHEATPAEVELLQALADSTSIAMENVQLYNELEQRVWERTAQLEAANKELEAFSYSVSHDLRTPLLRIEGSSRLVLDRLSDHADDHVREHLEHVRRSVRRMDALIADLLRFSHLCRAELRHSHVDLSRMAREIAAELQRDAGDREVHFTAQDGITAQGDDGVLRIALENLLSNAWKYTSKKPRATIVFGARSDAKHGTVYYVEDNGAGFDMAHAEHLFDPFHRLHPESEYPGTGIGLATVERIVRRHGGSIWAESALGEGTTVSFTLG